MSQPQTAIGPGMSPGQEDAHRRQLRDVYLAEAERAVETIEARIAGMCESLTSAKAEVERLKSLGETPEAGEI